MALSAASALLVVTWISVYQSVTVKGDPVPVTVVIQSALTGTDAVDIFCTGEPGDDIVLANKRIEAGDYVQWTSSTTNIDSSYTVCNFDLHSTQMEERTNINVWFGALKPDSLCDTFRYRCDFCIWEIRLDALYVKKDNGRYYRCRGWSVV